MVSGPNDRAPWRLLMPRDNGPLLVEGPVEVVMPDGSVRVSERPTVALCACRRSALYPFCDTSHRRRSRPRTGAAEGPDDAGGSESGY